MLKLKKSGIKNMIKLSASTHPAGEDLIEYVKRILATKTSFATLISNIP